MNKKRVFVSGCFDLLHSGHIAFLEEAASYGDVYVGLGSDKTISNLKNRRTIYSEDERLYIMRSIKFVKDAWINKGGGIIDFMDELETLKPDILFVNEDGDSQVKKLLCSDLGIKYLKSERIPKDNLPERSTTALRSKSLIPYRLDLAGGWLDQPFVSKHHPGAVITISIEPINEFNHRSGMASSTRNKAMEIWGHRLPDENPEKLAKILFSFENPPGKKEISGSQDSIGIVFPGLNRLNYDGVYWPKSIDSCHDDKILNWLEEHLKFLPLSPRYQGFNVLGNTFITPKNAKELAEATDKTWQAILNRDLQSFGKNFARSFDAQVKIFPGMVNREVLSIIKSVKGQALGWKLSGAGGGGYLVLVSEKEIPKSFKIKIRRSNI